MTCKGDPITNLIKEVSYIDNLGATADILQNVQNKPTRISKKAGYLNPSVKPRGYLIIYVQINVFENGLELSCQNLSFIY